MKPLTAKEIVHVWETGQNKAVWFKALLILAHALPEMTKSELIDLSIGQRNQRLFELRKLMYGSRLMSYTECPECREGLEFEVQAEDLIGLGDTRETIPPSHIEIEGIALKLHLPNSRDIATALDDEDLEAAHRILVQRCILAAQMNGVPLSIEALSEKVVHEFGEKIAEFYDPQAECLLELDCPACQHNWPANFNIVSYFWAELNAQSQRLLNDVFTLAQAFSWREDDILSMTAARRQFYLEMVPNA